MYPLMQPRVPQGLRVPPFAKHWYSRQHLINSIGARSQHIRLVQKARAAVCFLAGNSTTPITADNQKDFPG